jgi:signal transduction histidine kinase
MAIEHAVMVATHDHALVALSVLISILAAYASWALYERVDATRGIALYTWLVGGAIADGIGTWSMHYTGMHALRLPVPLYFDWPMVLLSLLVSIAGSGAALWVVRSGRLHWPRALAGSVLLGCIGVSGMHYTAMAAMRLPAEQHHASALMIVAVALAVAISWMALALTFSNRQSHSRGGARYHGGALLRGLANPVMHYTAMAGVMFMYSAQAPDMSHAVTMASLGVLGISVVPVMVLVVVLLIALADRLQGDRMRLLRSERQLREAIEDRERLGRDLHDNIIQAIYGIGMRLEGAQRMIKEAPAEAIAQIRSAIAGLNEVIHDVRTYITGSSRVPRHGDHVHAELVGLLRAIESSGPIRFQLSIDDAAAGQLTPEQAENIVQIAREALSNALRHSGGKQGTLALGLRGDVVTLEVSDDGVGFGLEAARQKGSGLRNMESRARQIGAKLEIRSASGQGTQVLARIPTRAQP